MAAEALTTEAVASRLERQEEDIRWLWAEVQRLRDEQLNAPDRGQAERPCLTREVAQLRAENRDLRHRLGRLRLCLAEELSRQATLGSAVRAAAQEEAGRTGAGAQVTRRRGRRRGRGRGRGRGGPRWCAQSGLRLGGQVRGRPEGVSAQRPAAALPCLCSCAAWGAAGFPTRPSSQSPEKDMKKKKMKESEPDQEVKQQPSFIKERLNLFEILKKDHQLLLAIYGKKGERSNVITVRVAHGQTVEGEVWKTTPYQVAAEIRDR
ncbi:hypothetical protein P7K49_012801 [Saguinus oedipus]|uniref:Uncharacterized protein n=1 Tax=Saguinus oedipus TaxID=9490 RepID=A0ABQ9VE35_SAGOE|nr:hypothetical protein P7K49_012801 [Saguinus oedipus]